jgi:hypothetical protein
VRYITKHNAKLTANLPSGAVPCITSMVACLHTLCNLLNKSAT